MQYEMPVVPAELKEPLIRFLSDREERIEFPPQVYSMLQDMGEAIALAVLVDQSGKIKEGWQLVPVKPTEDMVVSGFESEPREFFGTPEDWEKYQAMSGCQQAAHRAKLCWQAMLKAAPEHE